MRPSRELSRQCTAGLPPGFAPASRARLDDGVFDVRIVDGSAPWARVRLVAAALTGNLVRSNVYTRRLVSELALKVGAGEHLLAADGEVFEGHSEFTIEKHRDRLLVYVPESSSDDTVSPCKTILSARTDPLGTIPR